MKDNKEKKKIKTSNIVLAVIAIVLITFTITCLWIFARIGSEPSSLIVSVFGACLGEFGFLAWIRNTKQKYRDDAPFEGEEIIEEE